MPDSSTQNRDCRYRVWRCGDFALSLRRKTLVMAILNVTPDSFSGDGLSNRVLDDAVERAQNAIGNGADILDIGGESTRPGAQNVSEEEETRRVIPFIEKLAAQISIPISVDTTKSAVARRALDAGAQIVNDISGATADAQMLPLLAKTNCGIVLMHRRGTSQNMKASEMQSAESSCGNVESDVIAEVTTFWRERIKAAQKLGIALERIALDAGFGFGKSVEENLQIIRRGRELSDFHFEGFQFPILSGTSRKSSIGRVLHSANEEKNRHRVLDDAAEMQDRVWGTAATVALAIANGAQIVRVHDVREMANVARITDAIVRSGA